MICQVVAINEPFRKLDEESFMNLEVALPTNEVNQMLNANAREGGRQAFVHHDVGIQECLATMHSNLFMVKILVHFTLDGFHDLLHVYMSHDVHAH